MSEENPRRRGPLDPLATLAAFARVAYSDLVTVVAVSLLFTIASLPVVTLGPATFALSETVTATVTGRNRGGPPHERDRIALFVRSFRAHFRRGLALGVPLLAVLAITVVYATLAVSTRSSTFLVGAVLGLYAIVIVSISTLRTTSVVLRTEEPIGLVSAAREAAYLGLDHPSFTALHLVGAAGLLLLTGVFRIAVPLLLPGLLAVLEVVAFEEMAGDGAISMTRTYQGEEA